MYKTGSDLVKSIPNAVGFSILAGTEWLNVDAKDVRLYFNMEAAVQEPSTPFEYFVARTQNVKFQDFTKSETGEYFCKRVRELSKTWEDATSAAVRNVGGDHDEEAFKISTKFPNSAYEDKRSDGAYTRRDMQSHRFCWDTAQQYAKGTK